MGGEERTGGRARCGQAAMQHPASLLARDGGVARGDGFGGPCHVSARHGSVRAKVGQPARSSASRPAMIKTDDRIWLGPAQVLGMSGMLAKTAGWGARRAVAGRVGPGLVGAAGCRRGRGGLRGRGSDEARGVAGAGTRGKGMGSDGVGKVLGGAAASEVV